MYQASNNGGFFVPYFDIQQCHVAQLAVRLPVKEKVTGSSPVVTAMTKWLTKLWWFLGDRCSECGGELQLWDMNKSTCLTCKRFENLKKYNSTKR